MAWFFAQSVTLPLHMITGENARHISKSLRMKKGEELTVCDSEMIRHDGVIESIDSDSVCVRITESRPCENEPSAEVTLYQALSKGDKMEFIIQKAVELGASHIVPVLTARCVSRPDEKSMSKKLERWNKIALAAAMQSRRGRVPDVRPMMTLEKAAAEAGSTAIVCYELGGEPLGELPQIKGGAISLFIGSEGGFEESEVALILKNGGSAATLGSRILRAETAPLAALSVIMYVTGNLGSRNEAKRMPSGGDWNAGAAFTANNEQ